MVVAFLYSSVGHGGASGYLALMILFSFSISAMKINALVLNCFVAGISFLFFTKAKKIKLNLFYPFAITSIPGSFLGGYLDFNEDFIKGILGVILLFSIIYINGFLNKKAIELKPIRLPFALFIGFLIGLLSGMIGIGGGVILTPLLLILGWATIIEAASVSALFIFVNSVAGILGYFAKGNSFEWLMFSMIPFAILGGLLGSYIGSRFFSNKQLRYVLSFIVLLASIKLIFSE
ncbi:MAG TPA: hypothetical protein DDZ41_04535 [Flavobacterium sp.]|nr:hypothetical protein [Flavobacterium sp.]